MQTIHEAFAAWQALEARLHSASDSDFIATADEQAQIESVAIGLPASTARDAWALIAMTCNEDSDTTCTAEALFRRARAEASAPVPVSKLAGVFDKWLPISRKCEDAESSDADFAEAIALINAAVALPCVDALDPWRKVVLALWAPGIGNSRAADALLCEARQALGLKEACRH